MAEGVKCATVNQIFLPCIMDEREIKDMDWCGYVLECLKKSKDKWDREDARSWYTGPLIFLVVWYVNNITYIFNGKSALHLPILYWSSKKLRKREKSELKSGGFGLLKFRCVAGKNDDMNVVNGTTTSSESTQETYSDCAEGTNESTNETDDDPDTEVNVKNIELSLVKCKEKEDGYNPYDSQFINDVLWSKYDQCGEDEDHTEEYMAKDWEHEIGTLFKIICSNRAELVSKMAKAQERYPKDEQLGEIIKRVQDEMEAGAGKSENKVDSEDFGTLAECNGTGEETNIWSPEIEGPTQFDELMRAEEQEINDMKERPIEAGPLKEVENNQNFETPMATIQGVKTPIQHVTTPIINQETNNLVSDCVVSLGHEYVKAKDREIESVFKSRRIVKPSLVLRSPYRNRIVEIEKPLTSVEINVTECIFMGVGFEYDILFKHTPDLEVARVILESLIPDSYVHFGVINAWACLLNKEETFKIHASRGRLFCHSGMITLNMVGKTMTENAKYNAFRASMNNILRDNRLSKIEGELVFFPIIRAKHFYLLCFDLNKDEYFLIDNIAYDNESYERYEKVPELLRQLFKRYLRAVSKRVIFSNVNRLRMPLRTANNGVDCRVFIMHQMETFKGGGLAGFNSGFKMEGDEQNEQLFDLWHKYVSKILLSDFNEVKWKVCLEADDFKKIPNEKKLLLGADAQARVDERLQRCG